MTHTYVFSIVIASLRLPAFAGGGCHSIVKRFDAGES